MESILRYFKEAKAELRRVTWPTKKQLWYSTLVVVIVTLLAAAYLGLVDLLLTAIFTRIL
ncbi:MAG: preprotein translocase subunit SecE [Synergistaceae bacterium]|nr:preprotein translocase subunit SecE [Synergistaceae bacterium]